MKHNFHANFWHFYKRSQSVCSTVCSQQTWLHFSNWINNATRSQSCKTAHVDSPEPTTMISALPKFDDRRVVKLRPYAVDGPLKSKSMTNPVRAVNVRRLEWEINFRHTRGQLAVGTGRQSTGSVKTLVKWMSGSWRRCEWVSVLVNQKLNQTVDPF